jgi:hypothetical protein
VSQSKRKNPNFSLLWLGYATSDTKHTFQTPSKRVENLMQYRIAMMTLDIALIKADQESLVYQVLRRSA